MKSASVPMSATSRSFASTRWSAARCRCCCPPNHPLANQDSVTLKEISRYPLILSVDKTHYLESLLSEQGLEPIIMCRMGEDYSIANLVACGFGLAILPHNPQLTVTGAVLRPIRDPCAYRDFYMVTSRTRVLSPQAKEFRGYILSCVRAGMLDFPLPPEQENTSK